MKKEAYLERFYVLNIANIYRSIEAQQAAAAAAAKINQQLGVSQGNKPMIPGMSSPPGPKPGMPGLGMVVTEDYAVPDKLVGLSKYIWAA